MRVCNRVRQNVLVRPRAAKLVTAGQKVVLDHSAALVLRGIALEVATRMVTLAQREELGSRSYKLAGRQLRAEVAQISGCSEKK